MREEDDEGTSDAFAIRHFELLVMEFSLGDVNRDDEELVVVEGVLVVDGEMIVVEVVARAATSFGVSSSDSSSSVGYSS
jgi:hypothetical protein